MAHAPLKLFGRKFPGPERDGVLAEPIEVRRGICDHVELPIHPLHDPFVGRLNLPDRTRGLLALIAARVTAVWDTWRIHS